MPSTPTGPLARLATLHLVDIDMKTALVLGAGGMLGHQVMAELSQTLDVVGTARAISKALAPSRMRIGDLMDLGFVGALLDEVRPDFVVNCAGVIKQRIDQFTAAEVLQLNTLLPHFLGIWCQANRARLVHVSTDCVFRGDRTGPPYREEDLIDATDLYGYSKAAGEVTRLPSAVTLRTSIIGRELGGTRYGLLEWALGLPEGGTARGYRNHWWSGVTTNELARLIGILVAKGERLTGLYHVASAPISKLELLRLIADVFGRSLSVVPFDTPEPIYRVLAGSRIFEALGYVPPPLSVQLERLCSQTNTY